MNAQSVAGIESPQLVGGLPGQGAVAEQEQALHQVVSRLMERPIGLLRVRQPPAKPASQCAQDGLVDISQVSTGKVPAARFQGQSPQQGVRLQ